jgi:hypothetical protein
MLTLVSIDTTPNPNSMKLNLKGLLEISGAFTHENQDLASNEVKKLLCIEGIQSVFVSVNFLTINRDPRIDWQRILESVRRIFEYPPEDDAASSVETQRQVAEKQGQIQVLVQTFRDIPIQVKVTDGISEERVGLPAYFGSAVQELQFHFGSDYLKERHWADWGIRYGSLSEVGHEVAEEIENMLDEATLDRQKQRLLDGALETPELKTLDETSTTRFDSPDWNERLRIVQQLKASEASLPLLTQALHDEKPQIRRWAAAKLSGVKNAESVEALCDALLNDSNVGVRRTAGDSLSDIGDISAQEAVCKALTDPNKLVRWRAARFLAEVGDETALPYLEKASEDEAHEVRLEIEAAINHIQQGSNALGPVWKLMSQNTTGFEQGTVEGIHKKNSPTKSI